MRVLMVAPQPVFSPRGTPISILNRCRALTSLGHTVDVITYPLGDDVDVPGLRFLRGPRIPGIGSVKIGPSLAKLPLDASVFVRTILQLRRCRYDVIHTNEEAGVFGWLLKRAFRVQHIYEMHSDLAVVMTNYGFGSSHPLVRFAGWLERKVVSSADAVVVHFPSQLDVVAQRSPRTPVTLISDITIEETPEAGEVTRLRTALAPLGEPLIVYAGTLEPYQGMPLLVDAVAKLGDTRAKLVVVGGRPDQVQELRDQATRLGIGERLELLGVRPPEEVPAFLRAARVIVSPRNRGNNSPLKLLSYMSSGTPMVVTDIPSHTQLVDETTAVVTRPAAADFARGIDLILSDSALGDRLARAAQERFQERYTLRSFIESTVQAYLPLRGAPTRTEALLDAAVERLGAGAGVIKAAHSRNVAHRPGAWRPAPPATD